MSSMSLEIRRCLGRRPERTRRAQSRRIPRCSGWIVRASSGPSASRGRRALDIGASTGGFTDVLLQRGAESVIALDVGRGQLDWRLRTDSRVILREGVNARALTSEDVPHPISLVTIDVAFISLRHILP